MRFRILLHLPKLLLTLHPLPLLLLLRRQQRSPRRTIQNFFLDSFHVYILREHFSFRRAALRRGELFVIVFFVTCEIVGWTRFKLVLVIRFKKLVFVRFTRLFTFIINFRHFVV